MHDARYMALVEALGGQLAALDHGTTHANGFAGWLANAAEGVVIHAKNSTAVAHWCQ